MADRTLLVPGTQATNLLDQDGDRVYNVVRVNIGLTKKDLGKDPTAWVKLLSMEHAPGQLAPVRTSLRPRTQVRTGSVLRTPYEAFPARTSRGRTTGAAICATTRRACSSCSSGTSPATAAGTWWATPRAG